MKKQRIYNVLLIICVVCLLAFGLSVSVLAGSQRFYIKSTVYETSDDAQYSLSAGAKSSGTSFGSLYLSGNCKESSKKITGFETYNAVGKIDTDAITFTYSFPNSRFEAKDDEWQLTEDNINTVGDYELKNHPSYITTSDYEENNASDNNFIKVMRSGILESIYDMKVDYIGEENLLEGEDVKIVSEGLFTNTDDNSILFVEMKNTGDKTLRVSSSRIAINGVALTTGLWESNEITAGKTLVMAMNLSDVVRVAGGTFDSFGISKIATVETEINCQDLDNNDIFNKVITFKFSDGDAPFDKEGNEVYNSNDVRILSRKVTKDTYDNLHVGMLVENNSDTELRFEVEYDSLSINDTMTDFTAYTLHLQPGKVGILNIEISGYTLEDSDFSNPEDVKNAEFKLNITDANYHDIDEAVVKMEY